MLFFDEMISIKSNFKRKYNLFKSIQELLLNLNSAIKFKNIGIMNGKLYNQVYLLLEKDINKLSNLNLISNIYFSCDQEYKSIDISHEKYIYELNFYIDNLLQRLSYSIDRSLISIKNNNNKISLINNINIDIKSINKILYHTEIIIINPKYRHSNNRHITYNTEINNILLSYDILHEIINNRINHITKINEELLNNKIIQFYYLIFITCKLNNQYPNIRDTISGYLGNDFLITNNFKKIADFYYIYKNNIEGTIYKDFKNKFAEYILLF